MHLWRGSRLPAERLVAFARDWTGPAVRGKLATILRQPWQRYRSNFQKDWVANRAWLTSGPAAVTAVTAAAANAATAATAVDGAAPSSSAALSGSSNPTRLSIETFAQCAGDRLPNVDT